MDRYEVERERCTARYVRDFVSIPKLAGAMIGLGDWTLGLVGWGSILIPLAVLWGASWVLGKTVRWVAAGFRR
jgi:hypothetical protein